MLFRLREYDIAAMSRFRAALEELAPVVRPELRAFRVIDVEAVPTARVSIEPDHVLELPPTHLDQTISFDPERVVAGDLAAVLEPLVASAEELAAARLAYMKATLDSLTAATGQVMRPRGPLTWGQVMDAAAELPLQFDEHGEPTFVFWPPKAQAAFEALPPRTAEEQLRWRELMDRKRAEADARARDRRLR